jgi:hypothetical protein
MRAMLGGCGQTTFRMSIPTSDTDADAEVDGSAFFFLPWPKERDVLAISNNNIDASHLFPEL